MATLSAVSVGRPGCRSPRTRPGGRERDRQEQDTAFSLVCVTDEGEHTLVPGREGSRASSRRVLGAAPTGARRTGKASSPKGPTGTWTSITLVDSDGYRDTVANIDPSGEPQPGCTLSRPRALRQVHRNPGRTPGAWPPCTSGSSSLLCVAPLGLISQTPCGILGCRVARSISDGGHQANSVSTRDGFRVARVPPTSVRL